MKLQIGASIFSKQNNLQGRIIGLTDDYVWIDLYNLTPVTAVRKAFDEFWVIENPLELPEQDKALLEAYLRG